MSETIARVPSRTAPCPCRSGRRYKDCHGALATSLLISDEQKAHQLALDGLNAQKRQNLPLARAYYEQAIALSPNHADALHMLGMVHYELGEPMAAAPLVLRALDLTQWQEPSLRHNLGLILSKLIALRDGGEIDYGLSAKGRYYRETLTSKRVTERITSTRTPLVSVVVPSFNHAPYLRAALESIYAQTYREIEVVVIDDGSTDNSADIAIASLAECPFPHQMIRRQNRGAHATLNEAAKLSQGHYINPLNSDDLFTPQRIAHMVDAAETYGTSLVFSATHFVDANTLAIDPFADARVYSLLCRQANIAYRETVGNALLQDNVAVTTGNLFFSRALFDTLGGFRDFRYNHDWDFCLRALWFDEPHYLDEPLYQYRFHGSNTISESADKNRAEALRIHSEYFLRAFDPQEAGREFTPNLHQWGNRFVVDVLGSGLSAAVSPATLKAYALSLMPSRVVANRS